MGTPKCSNRHLYNYDALSFVSALWLCAGLGPLLLWPPPLTSRLGFQLLSILCGFINDSLSLITFSSSTSTLSFCSEVSIAFFGFCMDVLYGLQNHASVNFAKFLIETRGHFGARHAYSHITELTTIVSLRYHRQT